MRNQSPIKTTAALLAFTTLGFAALKLAGVLAHWWMVAVPLLVLVGSFALVCAVIGFVVILDATRGRLDFPRSDG